MGEDYYNKLREVVSVFSMWSHCVECIEVLIKWCCVWVVFLAVWKAIDSMWIRLNWGLWIAVVTLQSCWELILNILEKTSWKAIMLHVKPVWLSVYPSIHLCIAKESFCAYTCVCTPIILALYVIFMLSMPHEFHELDHTLRLLIYLYRGPAFTAENGSLLQRYRLAVWVNWKLMNNSLFQKLSREDRKRITELTAKYH